VGGKAFTSTILQQNCHEFVSYESLLDTGGGPPIVAIEPPRSMDRRDSRDRDRERDRDRKPQGSQGAQQQPQRQRPAPLDLVQAMPLVERALQVLERRAVQPQLGLLKSTMLQLDSAFTEKAYGANSFSDFVEKLKKADYVNVSGQGGRYVIERKASSHQPERAQPKPEEALPALRDVLETHRLELENGVTSDELAGWMQAEVPNFSLASYGYQEFYEFLNYAQDKLIVRVEPDEERGLMVYLGAEFYPPAEPEAPLPPIHEEFEEKQPIVEGQPSLLEPNPPPVKPKPVKRAPRKSSASQGNSDRPQRRPRKKKD